MPEDESLRLYFDHISNNRDAGQALPPLVSAFVGYLICKISKIIRGIVSSILVSCISSALSKVVPKRYSQQITGSERVVS